LSDEFNLRNIENEFHIFQELSLQTDKDLINEINEFNPQVIMVINQTERRITRGRIGGRPGATFDIKIFQPDYNSISWRASLKVDTFSDLGEGTKRALKKLIEKNVVFPNNWHSMVDYLEICEYYHKKTIRKNIDFMIKTPGMEKDRLEEADSFENIIQDNYSRESYRAPLNSWYQ